jgi:hypothetical protein
MVVRFALRCVGWSGRLPRAEEGGVRSAGSTRSTTRRPSASGWDWCSRSSSPSPWCRTCRVLPGRAASVASCWHRSTIVRSSRSRSPRVARPARRLSRRRRVTSGTRSRARRRRRVRQVWSPARRAPRLRPPRRVPACLRLRHRPRLLARRALHRARRHRPRRRRRRRPRRLRHRRRPLIRPRPQRPIRRHRRHLTRRRSQPRIRRPTRRRSPRSVWSTCRSCRRSASERRAAPSG